MLGAGGGSVWWVEADGLAETDGDGLADGGDGEGEDKDEDEARRGGGGGGVVVVDALAGWGCSIGWTQ